MSVSKIVAAAASGVGGAGLDIDEVFSTYLYEGNATTRNIQNGIDLTEGGLVWTKRRDGIDSNNFYDTERGVTKVLYSDDNAGQGTDTNEITAFNSNGYTLNQDGGQTNGNSQDYVSWTFRKAPKFFTFLTYTGTGSAQNISHDLGSDVGFLLIKRTDSTGNWRCWHRGLPGTGSNMEFNQTGAYETATTIFNGTDPTSTQFSVGTNSNVNASGGTYVAYVFAHNDGDGRFGPDGDQDIVKCGSYTGDGSTDGSNVINLGWEPQWVMVKVTSAIDSWMILDNIRGIGGTKNNVIRADTNGAEEQDSNAMGTLLPNGFSVTKNNDEINGSGQTYIYMAIRRGPLAQPESGTEVFAVDALQSPSTSPAFQSGFPVDLALVRNVGTTYDWYVKDRLRRTQNLKTNSTDAEVSWFSNADFDYMDGWYDSGTNTSFYSWMWKRAPGFCDVVAYSGNGVRGNTVSHNLGVAPEMIWVKSRDQADFWVVYHSAIGNETKLILDSTGGPSGSDFAWWAKTDPTASVFSVGESGRVNGSGENYIAYLFATLPGVSKVGSFTGNGTSQDINCGFTSGARFVLLKRTDSSGTWFILDTARGIVAGNDAILRPNTTTAEDNNYDIIDPLSSGFTINYVSAYNMNASGATYIFYAIA